VVEGGELRFKPQPVLADWLFTSQASSGFEANSFGFKLFGHTWVVYSNPKRQSTFGLAAVAPVAFELTYADGSTRTQTGASLSESLARDLRDGKLQSVVITLG
jgi:hypothetical protein